MSTGVRYNEYMYMCMYSVSPRINIKGGGVHQWYNVWSTMFNQCCKTE